MQNAPLASHFRCLFCSISKEQLNSKSGLTLVARGYTKCGLTLVARGYTKCGLTFVARGYTGKKLQDNIQCEIFQTILEEARESYKVDVVHELPSNTPDDMESNLERIMLWIQQWSQANNAAV